MAAMSAAYPPGMTQQIFIFDYLNLSMYIAVFSTFLSLGCTTNKIEEVEDSSDDQNKMTKFDFIR